MKHIKVLFIAGFGPIAREETSSRKLYMHERREAVICTPRH